MPSLKRHCNHITERIYSMFYTANENSKAINFSLSNEMGTIEIKANGQNTGEALANLVQMLRDTIDSLGIDVDVLNY